MPTQATAKTISVTIEGPSDRLTGYLFFWVKAVTGFEHHNHCAKCLKGPFLKTSHQWAPPLHVRREFELPRSAKALYICGVSQKGYAFNLHAPCQPDATAERIVVPMVDDQRLVIEGARLMAIPPLPCGWKGLGREFTTCRNYQFGCAYFGYPDKQHSIGHEIRAGVKPEVAQKGLVKRKKNRSF